MVKVEEKISDVKEKVSALQAESQKRIENLQELLTNVEQDFSQANEKQANADQKTAKIENEIKLHQNNIDSEKKDIEGLKAKLSQVNPDLESKKSVFDNLTSTIDELTAKKSDLETKIAETKTKKESLIKEQSEKQTAYKDLEGSIDKDLELNKEELNKVKADYDEVLEDNLIWDYMFGKIETPDIEIIAIIAANRGITMEEIKAKATSVSPVFVGRAISKLEAEDKIINKDNKWDLSDSLLSVIS